MCSSVAMSVRHVVETRNAGDEKYPACRNYPLSAQPAPITRNSLLLLASGSVKHENGHDIAPLKTSNVASNRAKCTALQRIVACDKADFEMDGFGRNPMIHVAGNCSHFPLQIRFTLVRITCQNTHTPKLPMLGPAPCRGK